MKNLLAVIAASTYANKVESPLDVQLTASDDHVLAGEGVTLSCSWSLEEDFADYGENKFQLYWKEKIAADNDIRALASYQGDEDDINVYYGGTFENRAIYNVSFDAREATLNLADLTISDDDTEIFCEIHWNKRFVQDRITVNVYDNADEVRLDAHDWELEGRSQVDNGTVIDPVETHVATCTVDSVYPNPGTVTFQVGDQVVEVDGEVTDNSDGTFTVVGELRLMPEGQYNEDEVSCFSVAAPDAERQENFVNDTFELAVTYYTDSVTLVIGGDADEGDEGEYTINEDEQYEVSCVANGNPAPTVRITNSKGEEVSDLSQSIAVRSESIQHITCTAENNDENFTAGAVVEDKAQLDVYWIDDIVLGDDLTEEYNEEFNKECNAQGHPAPTITWTKGTDDKNVGTNGDLDLGTLEYGEAGEYTCTASNPAGSVSDAFELTVEGPCIVTINDVSSGNSQQTEVPGQASLAMYCNVQGNDCQVEWEATALPGFIAANGKTEWIEEDKLNKLFFGGFDQFAEPVDFTCKATNDRGTVKDTVTIDDSKSPACCQTANSAGLGTGAIVGIVIAIPAILIIIGAAVFFCRKRNDDKNDVVDEGDDAEPEKEPLQADHDGEGGNAEDDAV
jgi:hypothetical protein